jgi:hypothetical protein
MTITLQGDTDEAIAWLQAWPANTVHLTAIHVDPETHEKGLIEGMLFAAPFDWDAVRAWIDARQGKANLYFTMNNIVERKLNEADPKKRNGKCSKADIAGVVCFHVDVDVPAGLDQVAVADEILARLEAFEPRANGITKSGGGCQAFWLLDSTAQEQCRTRGDLSEAERVECYTRALEAEFKADACHNVDRIMRLPGTINVPDAKKVAKGRVPMLARVVRLEMEPLHGLSEFKQAPPKDYVPTAAGGNAPLVGKGTAAPTKVSRKKVDIDWDIARSKYHDMTLEHLRQRGLEEQALLSLQYGDNLQLLHEHHTRIGHRVTEGPYESFSNLTMAIATACLKAELTIEECAAVMYREDYPGNKHVKGQKTDKEKRRAVIRALEKATADLEGSTKRARATAAGIPVWRECFDDAGLFPRPTLENARRAVQGLGITCRKDLFHGKLLVEYNGESTEVRTLVGEVNDDTLLAIRTLSNNLFCFDPGAMMAHDAVQSLAQENGFDPVLDYLAECQGKWDGVERVDSWVCTYLGVEDTPLNRAIGRKHLIASVRRARVPGCKYDCVLVAEGVEGTSKSTAIEVLAGKENFSDQTILGTSDREQQEMTQGVWLHELADLSGMARAEIERTKAFASRTVDRARRAYGRVRENQPRRCTFWATTNDSMYLISQTGNRRFLPLETGTIDIDALIRDRDQLWAEAAHLEAGGEALFLDPSLWGEAREAQELRRAVDPWEEALRNMPWSVQYHDGDGRQEHRVIFESYSAEEEQTVQRVANVTILQHVLRDHLTTANWKRLATVMLRLGWKRSKNGLVRVNGEQMRGFWRVAPPKVDGSTEGAVAGSKGQESGSQATSEPAQRRFGAGTGVSQQGQVPF